MATEVGWFNFGGVLVPPSTLSPYDGAQHSRKRRSTARGKSRAQDEDKLAGRYNRETLRLECLNLRRNHPVVAGACERYADNVVGPEGIMPQGKTTSRDWNNEAEAYWREWTKVCDVRNISIMRELQAIAVQSRMHSGDLGFVLLDNGQIQPVEADRIATPDALKDRKDVVDGVRLNPQGRPVSYYVCARDEKGYVNRDLYDEVAADNFVLVANRGFRFDSLRGIPELAPVTNTLSDHGDLTDAVLWAARVNARRTAVITTQGGQGIGNLLGARNGTPEGDDKGQVYENFGDEILTYYLNRGEDVRLLESNAPGANYVDHNVLLLKLVASALGIPYQFLLMDFESASFGANRVALMQTYRSFETRQSWIIDKMMQRLWNWRIAKAIKAGELSPAPVDSRGYSEWYKVAWIPPEYSWIDRNKEADADLKYYKMGGETLTSLNRKRARDIDDIFAEKADEIAKAAEVAAMVNARSGLTLTWRDIIDVAQPGQTAPSVEQPAAQQIEVTQ